MTAYYISVRWVDKRDGASRTWEIEQRIFEGFKSEFAVLDQNKNPFLSTNILLFNSIDKEISRLTLIRMNEIAAIEFFAVETNPLEDENLYDDPLN